jgi:hypothetical protein
MRHDEHSVRKVMTIATCATAGFATGLALVALARVSVAAQGAAPAASQERAVQAAPTARVFGSDAGIVLNFIKPDKTGDFEAIVAKLGEALQKSEKPERKQQAASWKVFRAIEPGGNGSVLYVFAIDPAVKGADYTVSTILAEAFPGEVEDLWTKIRDAYSGARHRLSLQLIAPPTPLPLKSDK